MTGNKNNRLSAIEKKVIIQNYGLRVVMPVEALYADDPENHLYWTDEAVKSGWDAFYEDGYRRVEHPEGKKATRKDM